MNPIIFVDSLEREGLDFYVGVPDSLLKNFCAYVEDNCDQRHHIIAANEGNAIGIAAGYYMAVGKYAAVYLQNSGLGNAINPLVSIADKEVYSIPMLLIIGWRGEPDINDEPQHVKQGRITIGQLELLEIPFRVIDANVDEKELAVWVKDSLIDANGPVALLVKKDTFSSYKGLNLAGFQTVLTREQALYEILTLAKDAAIISTTGKTSRELFELRKQRGELQQDFLTVGGMGHTASIGLGVALGSPQKTVVCLDGDGSVLMHMGALPVIGSLKPTNFLHIMLNNAAHESVGGQPTVADRVDFRGISLASGYAKYSKVTSIEDLREVWLGISEKPGPHFIEIVVANKSRDDLGRPASSPQQNKEAFMAGLRD
uniref:phosphonopyruvate decarboxylase n=1 Tax=Polynucleobacter sp. TaxID=2029855 RepID=UPI004048BD12